jgi:hypothetical protein
LVPPSTYKKSSRTTQPIWDLKIGEKTNIMKDIFCNLIAKKRHENQGSSVVDPELFAPDPGPDLNV